MKPYLPLVFLAAALSIGCSKKADAPAAPDTASQDASAAAQTAVPEATPLPAELAARLVRPHSPVIGPADAPVTLVEFLDPACEACRAYAPVVKQILFLHPDEVRVVVRYAAFHHGSDEAVRILDAARKQGRFDEVLSALFDAQPEWAAHGAPDLARAWQVAGAAGLDIERARRDAKSAAAGEVLKIDDADIVALQVESTPTFFVNGARVDSHGVNPLLKRVADAVAAAKASTTPAP